ncbi:MAG: hypothetical protein B5M53_03980 [Candidatus Cloacimonas sp. 4484_209]|nr:MAG: hypothetical protein B5M53_03980 [Candidatus Cloacimonas sp. 4484_209]
MKILVIGLDGADIDLIKRWAQEGKLPTFEKLMREGSYGYLESVIPTITIPAWNCLATGKNPGKIGCFSFIQKAYGSYDFKIYSSMIKRETDIWKILSDFGKRVIVLNSPNILNAYKINGYMVAGCLCTSEKRLTYPEDLRKVLYDLDYESDIVDPSILATLRDSEYSRRHKEITDKHFKVLLHLLEQNWDFGFCVFTELDRIQHRFWNRESILLSHYQNIDRKLGDLLERLERSNNKIMMIIVSDHGFGSNRRSFLINEWLIKKDLLKVRRIPVLDIIKVLLMPLVSILRKPIFLRMLNSISRLPLLKQLYRGLSLHTGKTPIQWDKTKAFSYGTWGTIYINLEGREPRGTVKKEEYEQLRTEIIEGLKEISVKAYRKEELYHGEYMKLAPDIILQTDDYINSINGKVGYGREFIEDYGGAHRINGTFIAWGPGIKKNFEINAKIYDIAPTILHIFGIPIPKDMDGRVLKEIFEGELAMREVKYQEMEREKIRRRIRKLKYTRRI